MRVHIAHGEADQAVAEELQAYLHPRGLVADLETGARGFGHLQASDVVIVLWSQNCVFTPHRMPLEKRMLDAWADERLVLVRLDHHFLPVGMRDLPAIDASFETSRHMTAWRDVERKAKERMNALLVQKAAATAPTPARPSRSTVSRRRGSGKFGVSDAIDVREDRQRSLESLKRARARERARGQADMDQKDKPARIVAVSAPVMLKDLATRMDVRVIELVKYRMKQGDMARADDVLDVATAVQIVEAFGQIVDSSEAADEPASSGNAPGETPMSPALPYPPEAEASAQKGGWGWPVVLALLGVAGVSVVVLGIVLFGGASFGMIRTDPRPSPVETLLQAPILLGILIVSVVLLSAMLVLILRRVDRSSRSKPSVISSPAAVENSADQLHAPEGAVFEAGTPERKLVFISYAHADDTQVSPVVTVVESSGRGVWIDKGGIQPGEGWAGEIVRAIKAAGGVMVMCSSRAFQSDHVKREIYLADRYGKPMLPVFLEEAQPPEDFEYFFAGVQWLELFRLPETDHASAVERALANVS